MILFRGGMCGDLIGKILDPSIVDENNNLSTSKTLLKKYWKMSLDEKIDYVNNYKNKDIVLLSHDTELAYQFTDITVQIICEDLSLMDFFAFRFHKLHKQQVIDQVNSTMDENENFVEEYKNSLINWQNYHINFKRFDISNIRSDIFLKDLSNFFNIEITDDIKILFHDWKKIQLEKFPNYFK